VDANQAALVTHARAFGASWVSLASLGSGVPDGLLGLHGHTFLVEFKTAKGTLTPDQRDFIDLWRGGPVYLLRTTEDVERLISGVLPKRRAARPRSGQDAV
jgi:hypothetical protein